MQNNKNRLSLADVQKMSSTPAGQELIRLLSTKNLDSARQAAQKGDYAQAKAALGELMKSPRIQQLLKEMEQSNG